jgi:hypothetical protein
MTGSDQRESLDRRVEEVRKLLRERLTLVDPDPRFADRVIARLPRTGDGMLAWAARRVLPATLALAAVLTIAVLVTGSSARRQAEAASIASTGDRGNDPLEWLLETRQEAR